MITSKAQAITASAVFQRIVVGTILFSAILLGLETSQEAMAHYGPWLKILDGAVLGIFIAEILLKIIARGSKPWEYFYDPWNSVDFFIVAACLVPTGSNTFAIFRLVRVLRILRLVTAFPKLQIIVSALLKSVPSMGYVVALLSIHFYMFGVLGTFLFAGNDPVHFGSLGKTFLSLFQILTLEGWADIMRIQIYGCASFGYESFQAQCTGSQAQPIAAIAYFISFIVMGTMIILNLLIGVVVNGMAESHKELEGNEAADHSARALEQLTKEIHQLRADIQSLQKKGASH